MERVNESADGDWGILRITAWADEYENHRSRPLKKIGWFPVTNKLTDSDRYGDLIDHPNGPAHFGVLVALLAVASKSEPRGYLLRDLGKPHDARSLARVTSMPAELIREAVPRLISLEYLQPADAEELRADATKSRDLATKSRDLATESQEKSSERNGNEANGNGTEQRRPDRNGTARNGTPSAQRTGLLFSDALARACSLSAAEIGQQRPALDAVARRIAKCPKHVEIANELIQSAIDLGKSKTVRRRWAAWQSHADEILAQHGV